MIDIWQEIYGTIKAEQTPYVTDRIRRSMGHLHADSAVGSRKRTDPCF